jgi:RluA family pseudouridine synthase
MPMWLRSENLQHELQIVDQYSPCETSLDLLEALLSWDPRRFPSKSQAKKACRLGSVLVIRKPPDASARAPLRQFHDYSKMSGEAAVVILGEPTSVVLPGDIVAIQTRTPDHYYPVAVTKYILPPADVDRIAIVYEDDHLAVVNKPENMTTIGMEREDLQSCLGFLLRPSPLEPMYHPRPVHRLDRRTSGLVLVAKTQASMRFLSQAFASRSVTKTYTALVLGNATASGASSWQTIDYPIDGRSAVSEWREVASSPPLSLVEVRPHTGRTHQIRRHLSYCVGMPIVGDAKYDKGAKHLRTNGMYLCCHSLEFPHIDKTVSPESISSESAEILESDGCAIGVRVTIPLPEKFFSRLDIRS